MNIRDKMRKRLKLNRPSLRARARPPKHRSAVGTRFSAANLPGALAMQHCTQCQHVQYPPTELCGVCLEDALVFREVSGTGVLLASSELHHSLWEYFKRRLKERAWPIGSVQLDAGPVLITHLADTGMAVGDQVQVISHTDAAQVSVLIAAPASRDLASRTARQALVAAMGLDKPALREGGA